MQIARNAKDVEGRIVAHFRFVYFNLSLHFHYLPATSDDDTLVLPASEEGSTAIENTGAFALYRCWEELEFSDLKGSFILSSDSLNWCKIWGSHLVQWYSVLTIVSMATRLTNKSLLLALFITELVVFVS